MAFSNSFFAIITAALTVLSGCFDKINGVYDNRIVYPTLFSMVIANAAAGKGVAIFAKQMATLLHKKMIESSGANTPASGTKEKLFMPANSSSASLMKMLEASKGKGIIFETEIDTLTNTIKQDWAGFSDLLRKGFHHEAISYSRKKDNEFVEIDSPRFALMLTGTPGQVPLLIPSTENGLFSRMLFYRYSSAQVWKDVFRQNGLDHTTYFENLSGELLVAAGKLNAKNILFKYSSEQEKAHNDEFTLRLAKIKEYCEDEDDAASSVFRLGLITFRIAMILSIVRLMECESVPDTIECSDIDFQTAMALTETYLAHAVYMMRSMPKSSQSEPLIARLYDALPAEFTRAEGIRVGLSIGMKKRNIDGYLNQMLGKQLDKAAHGRYKKK